jgi:hypothetical protein
MSITYAVGQRISAATLQALADYTVNRPLVRLVSTAAQNLADNTATSIAFGTGSTLIDTHGYHSESTNNTRVTPVLAGYYEIFGLVAYGAATTLLTLQTVIRLNGVDQPGNTRQGPNATSSARSTAAGPITLFCDGLTNYIEVAGLQDNSGGTTIATTSGGTTVSYLEVKFLRPA